MNNDAYKLKYMKYKAKYMELKDMIAGMDPELMNPDQSHVPDPIVEERLSEDQERFIKILRKQRLEYLIIPKNTTFYRSAPIGKIKLYSDIISQVQVCEDTGKEGIYLSSNILISMAMMLEYNKIMEIGRFVLNKPIILVKSKYGYRHITPEKYFFDWESNRQELKLHVTPSYEENISHIDCGILPLKESQMSAVSLEIEKRLKALDPKSEEYKKLITYYQDLLHLLPIEKRSNTNLCEIFISSNDIEKDDIIKLNKKYKINDVKIKSVEDLLTFIKENDYPKEISFYIDKEILVEF